MILAIALVLAPATAQTSAAAPVPVTATANRAALARAIALDAYVSKDAETAFLDNFMRSFRAGVDSNPKAAAFLKTRPDVRAEVETAARAEAAVQYPLIVLPALIAAVADAYAANFTEAELTELKTYYDTPAAQRLLPSFAASDAATAVPIARSDPTVVRFLASPTARKEQTLGTTLAQTMALSMQDAGMRVAEAVQPKIRAALQAALARPAPSK